MGVYNIYQHFTALNQVGLHLIGQYWHAALCLGTLITDSTGYQMSTFACQYGPINTTIESYEQ